MALSMLLFLTLFVGAAAGVCESVTTGCTDCAGQFSNGANGTDAYYCYWCDGQCVNEMTYFINGTCNSQVGDPSQCPTSASSPTSSPTASPPLAGGCESVTTGCTDCAGQFSSGANGTDAYYCYWCDGQCVNEMTYFNNGTTCNSLAGNPAQCPTTASSPTGSPTSTSSSDAPSASSSSDAPSASTSSSDAPSASTSSSDAPSASSSSDAPSASGSTSAPSQNVVDDGSGVAPLSASVGAIVSLLASFLY